jgi:hypothetical protein
VWRRPSLSLGWLHCESIGARFLLRLLLLLRHTVYSIDWAVVIVMCIILFEVGKCSNS